MFFETQKNIDFAGYADDNTPYKYSSNIEEVLENLQGALEQLFSVVLCKSLGSKCRKVSPSYYFQNNKKCRYL